MYIRVYVYFTPAREQAWFQRNNMKIEFAENG